MPAGISCSNHCTMSKKALKAMQKTCFVAMCGMFRTLQNIAKTVVLLHEEYFCDACVLTPKIIEKCLLEGSKTLPRPPKIEPAATPSPKKTTNMSQKSARSVGEPAKSEKKTPQSEKCANIVPTWRDFDLEFGSFWPPLSKEKQYVNASIKCSGL